MGQYLNRRVSSDCGCIQIVGELGEFVHSQEALQGSLAAELGAVIEDVEVNTLDGVLDVQLVSESVVQVVREIRENDQLLILITIVS